MRCVCGIALALTITGCAQVQQQSVVATSMGQSLTAGVGDVVLRAEGRENMPNAYGKADIFGRTRTTGFSTVLYGGIQGNKVVLLRNGVVTQSDATTMNSTPQGPLGIPAGSTSVSSQHPGIPVIVDWKTNPRVPAMGRTIVIEAADAVSLTYRIE